MLRCGVVLVGSVGLLVGLGCTTPEPGASRGRLSEDEILAQPSMMSLERWSAAPSAPSAPLLKVSAFDYWALEPGQPLAQALWPGLFSSLDYMRAQLGASGEQARLRQTFDMLLAVMEPQSGFKRRVGEPRQDLTFVTGKDVQGRDFEGVICRMYAIMDNDASPGVVLMMVRRVGEAQPGEVWLWGSSGHEEGPPFSARLARGDQGQEAQLVVAPGLGESLDGALVQERSEAATLMLEVLIKGLWPKVSHQAYAEPTLILAKGPQPPVAAYPVAAGLLVKERELEEIYQDTAFMPTDELDLGELPAFRRSGE